MGNSIDKDCPKNSPLCACLNSEPASEKGMEIDVAGGEIIQISSGTFQTSGNEKSGVIKSSKSIDRKETSKSKAFVQRGSSLDNSKTGLKTKTAGKSPPSKAAKSTPDIQDESVSNKDFKGTGKTKDGKGDELASGGVKSDAGKVETKVLKVGDTRKEKTAASPRSGKGNLDKKEISSGTWKFNQPIPIDVKVVTKLLPDPVETLRDILNALYKTWDTQGAGLSLDELNNPREVLIRFPGVLGEMDADDKLFQALDTNGMLNGEAFTYMALELTLPPGGMQPYFQNMKPSQTDDGPAVEMPEARAVLQQMAVSVLRGPEMTDNLWELILDSVVGEGAYMIPFPVFDHYGHKLSCVIQALNVLYSQ